LLHSIQKARPVWRGRIYIFRASGSTVSIRSGLSGIYFCAVCLTGKPTDSTRLHSPLLQNFQQDGSLRRCQRRFRCPTVATVEQTHHVSTADQTGEQRPTASGGLARHTLPHVGFLGHHQLILLGLRPSDLTRMMVADQDVPRMHGPVMAVCLACSSFHDSDALTCASEHVSASIDRIVQEFDDHVVLSALPLDATTAGV
jgi:hypothetical protein